MSEFLSMSSPSSQAQPADANTSSPQPAQTTSSGPNTREDENTPSSATYSEPPSPIAPRISFDPTVARLSFRGYRPPYISTMKTMELRKDPTLITCFDPADKELYDLWAPND